MAEVVVIVNPENPVARLSREQVVDIYMGRYSHFPDGSNAVPFDLSAEAATRETYYEKLISKSVAQVNAFWARLRFSGRASPPRELHDSDAAIMQVSRNRSAIAYVDSEHVNEKAKVVLRLP